MSATFGLIECTLFHLNSYIAFVCRYTVLWGYRCAYAEISNSQRVVGPGPPRFDCHWLLICSFVINPLNPELNPICYFLALLGAHHFFHVSRIRVKLLTFRLLMLYIYIYIYIYGAPILDVSRSHTTTQHSR